LSEEKTIDQLVKALMKLFVNRDDTYGLQGKDGSYRRVNKPLTTEVIKQHLKRKITVGCYQIDPTSNSVKWLCFDIDPERIDDAAKVALKIFEGVRESFGDEAVLLEASRHPDPSYHIWIFFDPPILTSVAKFVGETVLKNLHLKKLDIELFPKQETITEEGFGNLVKMPLGVHRKHNKRSCFLDVTLEPLPNSCVLDVQPHKMREITIQRILAELNGKNREYKHDEQKSQKTSYRGDDPPCIQALMKGVPKGIRNEAAIRLASYWVNLRGVKPYKAFRLLNDWNTRNKQPLKITEIRSISRSASKAEYNYGCEDELLRRFCTDKEHCPLAKARAHTSLTDMGRPKKQPEEKVHQTPFVELSNNLLCEQAFDGQKVFYLVYNTKTDSVRKSSRMKDGVKTYTPIDNDEVRKGLVLLPSDIQDFGNEEQLMKDIKAFLNKWHEPVDEESRILDVFYILLTYIKDLVPQLPYRRILAYYGHGKSAWLESLGWISYRGIILAGSDTDKSLVRRMNIWQGTALIDEADFGNSTLYSFIVKILNIGYDQKTGYYQRCDENDAEKTVTYGVYGPKILATRAKYKDSALESRCLTTRGRQNRKPVPLFRMKSFQKEAQELRNKLIYWRFKNYYRIKKRAVKLEDPNIAKEVYGENSKISSRIKQVILPLWVVGGDQMKATLKKLAERIDEKMKTEDPNYLLELQAKEAVKSLIEKGKPSSSGERVNKKNVLIGGLQEEKNYEIDLAKISEKILEQQGYLKEEIKRKEKISVSKRLKRIFELNLGFNVKIGHARRRVVLIPKTWVKPETSEVLFPKEHSKDTDIHQQKRREMSIPTPMCVLCHEPILLKQSRTQDPSTHKPCHMTCYRKMKEALKVEESD